MTLHRVSRTAQMTTQIAACLPWILWSSLLCLPVSSAAAAESGTEALIEQLGADAYSQRLEAEQKLRELGLPIRDDLLAGLQSSDLQIRRTCRRLLDDIRQDELMRRVAPLLADETGDGEHDLPSWSRYRQVAGADEAARRLYFEILQAEPGLLQWLDDGAAGRRAIAVRFLAIRDQIYGRGGGPKVRPSVATLAAVTLVASDPSLRPESSQIATILTILFQEPFVGAAASGSRSEPLRRLLAELVLSGSDLYLSQTCLYLALKFDLKEAGLRLALRMIQDRKALPGQRVAGAAGTLAMLGGRDYAAALVPLLDDSQKCGLQVVRIGQQPIVVQLRDVAAAWLIKVTGQELKDYGLERAETWFRSIERNPAACFTPKDVWFDGNQARQAGLEKLRAWLEAHPPAEISLEPAPPTQPAPKIEVAAQAPSPAKGSNRPNAQPTVRRPQLADAEAAKQLAEVRQYLAQEQFGKAAALLVRVAQAAGDRVFQPTDQAEVLRSVQAEIESVVSGLNAEGRRRYELEAGALARQKLERCLNDGDIAALDRVQRQYFYTEAGWEAAYLLAVYYRTQGQPWLASRYIERLLQRTKAEGADNLLPLELAICQLLMERADEARATLRDWKRQWAKDSVTLGGESYALFTADDDPCEWLQRTLRIQRNESLPRVAPRDDFMRRYLDSTVPGSLSAQQLTSIANPSLAASLEQIDRSPGAGYVRTLQPLAVGRLLIERTMAGLQAVDRETGDLQWFAPADNGLGFLLKHGDAGQYAYNAAAIERGLRQRLWYDAGWGAVTSNGRLMFALDDSDFDLRPYQPFVTQWDGSVILDNSGQSRENALAAYDVATGKLVWQIGSVFGQRTPELNQGTILGPPLPLGDRLYVVVDYPEETRLAVLDADTGAVRSQWTLEVHGMPGKADTSLLPTPSKRRTVPLATPVYVGGLVVCGTPGNRFVASDAAAGATVWSRPIEPPEPPKKNEIIPGQFRGPITIRPGSQLWGKDVSKETDRWVATEVVVCGDRLLLTPVDADRLYCAELTTGRLLWDAPRGDGLYVVAAEPNMALIVGQKSLRAVRVDDGQPAWEQQQTAYLQDAIAAGRGFASGDRYFLPLSSGKIAVYDITDGKLLRHIAHGSSAFLGNLSAADGALFSATACGTWRLAPQLDR